MTKRVHMGIGYHHNGLLVLSGIGLAILAASYLHPEYDATVLTLTAVVVVLVMLVQLIFDYRSFETEYLFLTTDRSDRKKFGGIGGRIKYKWPTLILIPLFFIAPFFTMAGAFLFSMIMWFPLQRKMYLRSYEEFGSNENSAT